MIISLIKLQVQYPFSKSFEGHCMYIHYPYSGQQIQRVQEVTANLIKNQISERLHWPASVTNWIVSSSH